MHKSKSHVNPLIDRIFEGISKQPVHQIETPDRAALLTTRFESADPQDKLPDSELSLPTFPGYKTLARLGQGGMGIVYKAYDENLDQLVAIKMLQHKLAGDHLSYDRFRSEARLLARLRHDHIISVYSADLQDGYPYFIMEYHPRGALSRHVKEFADPEKATSLISQVATAIEFAHAHGVLHRDLKPANILLDARSRAVVSDFGLAKMVSALSQPAQSSFTDHGPITTLTATLPGSAPGTPAYMAPEQYNGGQLTLQTDIWSMGIILFELIAGVRPFNSILPAELAKEVRTGLNVEPHRMAPAIPLKLSRIIARCLQVNPAERYASAAELSADLNHAFARRTRRAFLIAGGVLLTGGGVVVGNQMKKQADLDRINQQFTDNCADLRRELVQKHSINLLNEEHLPRAYYFAAGNPFTRLQNIQRNSFSQIVKDTLLLDLIDYLPTRHFSIACRVKTHYCTPGAPGRFALYCSRELGSTSRNDIHVMYALSVDPQPDLTSQVYLGIYGLTNDVLSALHMYQFDLPLRISGMPLNLKFSVRDDNIECSINDDRISRQREAIVMQLKKQSIAFSTGSTIDSFETVKLKRPQLMPMNQGALGIFAHRVAFEIDSLSLSL